MTNDFFKTFTDYFVTVNTAFVDVGLKMMDANIKMGTAVAQNLDLAKIMESVTRR